MGLIINVNFILILWCFHFSLIHLAAAKYRVVCKWRTSFTREETLVAWLVFTENTFML